MNRLPVGSLRLQNFRSYNDFAVEFSPGVNIVVGPNACGKTNLLEALMVTCGLSSYRARYGDLIANGSEWSRVDASMIEGNRVIKLKRLSSRIISREYEINEKVKKRLSFSDQLPVVLFEPEHMRLLTGSPNLRREFFDQILSKTKSDFAGLKSKYIRALAQRNNLLKNSNSRVHEQIFVWNVRLSELAGKIVEHRMRLVEELNKHIPKIYSEIAGSREKVIIEYVTNISANTYETDYLKKLEADLSRDQRVGFTSLGPHREDFLINLRSTKASQTASRGETRTLVIALKLLELNRLYEVYEQKPIILLDDVFSELDGSRRQMLTKYLVDYQTVITTTDADVVGKVFAQESNLISL